MSMELNKGLFSQLGPMYDRLLSMSPTQIMTSGAPEFLKIAAMQQQGRAREALSAPVPPSSTVAQDVVQRAVAPTGIGALPTSAPASSPPALAAAPSMDQGVTSLETSPDMFNERYYADGGIVGFAEGDYIPKGDYIRRVDPDTAYLDPAIVFGRTPSAIEARKKLEEQRAKIVRGEVRPPVTGRGLGAGKPGAFPPSPVVTKLDTESKSEKSVADKNKPSPEIGISAIPSEFMPSTDQIRSGIGAIDINAPQMKYTPYRAQPEKSREEFLTEFGKDLEEAGVDREGLAKRQRERVGKLEEQFAKESAQAPGIALVELGLTMASTPGTFGQALATGAQAGLASYLRSKRDLKADERELLKMQDALDEAEYARKMEDVTAYRQYRQKAEEARSRAEEINYKARMDVEQYNKAQQFEAQKLQLQEQGRREELASLNAYRAAELAKDYATMQATLGKARIDAMADIAKAANKGALTQQQMLEYLTEEAEKIKDTKEFRNMIEDREGITEDEINAEALNVARSRLGSLQIIFSQLQTINSALSAPTNSGIGGLGGFTLTPAETE